MSLQIYISTYIWGALKKNSGKYEEHLKSNGNNDRLLTLVLLNPDIPCLANSVNPDQLASEEANWSGSALFAIQFVNLYQQSGSSILIGWKFEKGVAS